MSIFGGAPDNPISGQTPGDTLGDDAPIGLSDQGDSLADDEVQDPNLGDQGSHASEHASEAVRDPAGLASGGLEDDPLG